MVKRTGIFDVNVALDLNNNFNSPKRNGNHNLITAKSALDIVIDQMETNNYRHRTIRDYRLYFNEFVTSQGISYVDEIDTESIYSWLDSMDVKPVTKLNRLKCLKALLTRFRYNGWIN